MTQQVRMRQCIGNLRLFEPGLRLDGATRKETYNYRPTTGRICEENASAFFFGYELLKKIPAVDNGPQEGVPTQCHIVRLLAM